jgi:hypothetical protein
MSRKSLNRRDHDGVERRHARCTTTERRVITTHGGDAHLRAASLEKEVDSMTSRSVTMGLVLAVALAGFALPSQAAVNVNIGINLGAPPSLVTIPGTPVAYAPAAPANVFFYQGQYWVFTNNAWYAGPTYRGPWEVVAPTYIPQPLLTVPVRYFRAPPVAWQHWHRQAPPHWNPAWGRDWDDAHAEYRGSEQGHGNQQHGDERGHADEHGRDGHH